MWFGYRSYNRVGPVGSLDLMQEYENYTSLLEQKNIPLYVWVCISKRFFLRCAMEGGGVGLVGRFWLRRNKIISYLHEAQYYWAADWQTIFKSPYFITVGNN